MSDLNSHVMVPDEPDDESAWGHHQRRKHGGRHWGVPPSSFKLHIDSVETVPHDTPARVENLGTAQVPNLKFFIPAGAPGQDFVPERGATGRALGQDFSNGVLKTIDQTVRIVRSFIASGEGVRVTSEFTEDGAISVFVDASGLADTVRNSIDAEFSGRITALEKAIDFDSFKTAVAAYSKDYGDKLLEIAELKQQFLAMKVEYESLKYKLLSLEK